MLTPGPQDVERLPDEDDYPEYHLSEDRWLFWGSVLTVLALLASTLAPVDGQDWYVSARVGTSGVEVQAGRRSVQRARVLQNQPAPPSSGWPDATNTGVPSGTTLTAYGGSCNISANTTITAKEITCPSGVQVAAVVTITNSLIHGHVRLDTDSVGSSAWSLTLTDSEVDGEQIQEAAICCGNMDVLRANLHGGQTAGQCEETSDFCTITDSYLHGQYLPPDQPWHLGGFLSDGTKGAGCTRTWCIELVHNYVICDHAMNALAEGCSGDINLIPNFNYMRKVRVHNNRLGANIDSSFCTYGGEKATSSFPNGDHITYTDNVFERGSNNNCAAFGPVNAFNSAEPTNVWTNNTWLNDGTTVPPAN